MTARLLTPLVCVLVACSLNAVVDTRPAGAGPCTDVEVVSARGTNEPPGPGSNGQVFVDELRPKLPGRGLQVYAVDYPASVDLMRSASAGADDALAHVLSTAATCPGTRIVLAGYSQGAAVTDLATERLPPEAADHVAAIVVFGNPRSALASRQAGVQLPSINPTYRPKTIDLCVPGDPICSDGTNEAAHHQYIDSGMTEQAATFVAGKLQ